MEQRISLVTLGVDDLARARRFYEGLGWHTNARPEDDVVFFQAGGMILARWERASPVKRGRPSGAATRARSRIQTGTRGRSRTTRAGRSSPTAPSGSPQILDVVREEGYPLRRTYVRSASYPGDAMLTGRQQEIWTFLTRYVDEHGYPPTVREIGEAVGLASPSTVHAHL